MALSLVRGSLVGASGRRGDRRWEEVALSELAVEIEGVRKTYGKVVAVEGLDLRVPMGSVTGFLGPNGSGKTTTMRMILSILLPDRGSLRVLGRASALESRPRIGYIPEDRGLYKDTGVHSFLRYLARLKGVATDGLDAKIDGWLERVGLAEQAKARCGTLSRGMQQKVQALAALIHEPDLLILDEPFSGLDPVNRRLLANLFLEQRDRGATLILSTHILEHAEALCDQVVMMHRGEKVLDGSLAEVRSLGGSALSWVPVDLAVDPTEVEALPEVERVVKDGEHFLVSPAPGVSGHALIPVLSGRFPTRSIGEQRASLEEVFLATVAQRERGAA